MSTLKELEKRLRDEPDNIGLRVMVAGAMREVGRQAEAVELYRSVAMAYRDQGRTHQAIAVCRSMLEIVPDDVRCHALLALLVANQPGRAALDTADIDLSPPLRPSTAEETPLPPAIPYHVHDPTTSMQLRVSDPDLLPTAEGALTHPGALVGSIGQHDDREDMAAELETRQMPRVSSHDLEKLSRPPPTDDDAPTLPPGDGVPDGDDEDEKTQPRELPVGLRPRAATQSTLTSSFFAHLPPEHRAAALARFQRRSAAAGKTVIRQGETNHPLVIVARGHLDVRVERASGAMIQVGLISIGEYVGESALLARSPAAAHVIAVTEVELLILAPRDFYELAGAFPALWAELKDVAERRTREHDQRIGRA